MNKLAVPLVALVVLAGVGYGVYRHYSVQFPQGGTGPTGSADPALGSPAPRTDVGGSPTASSPAEEQRRSEPDREALRLARQDLLQQLRIEPGEQADAVGSRVQATLRLAEAILQATPRDSFSAEAVVRREGRDPDVLATWVRDHVRWVPYRGTLRGASGTLMDRTGNSLDRSLLLAQLLESAGKRARLAHTRLPADAARRLLDAYSAQAPPAHVGPSAGAPGSDGSDAVLDLYARRSSLDAAAVQPVIARANTASADIVSVTQGAIERRTAELLTAISPVEAIGSANADDAAGDHWWVQVQEGPGWRDLDIASGSPWRPPAAPTETMRPADLPDELRHQVVIRVVVEQALNGRLVEHVALERSVPASEPSPRAIVLRHRASSRFEVSLEEDAEREFARAATEEDRWLPVLALADRTVQQSGFTTAGTLVDASAFDGDRQGQQGGLGLIGGLGGVLGGGEAPRPSQAPPAGNSGGDLNGQLTAEWLEFEVRVPGGSASRTRRSIFDIVGPAARRDGRVPVTPPSVEQRLNRGLALLGETLILPLGCRFSNEYVRWHAARAVLDNRAVLEALPALQFARPDEVVRRSSAIKPIPGLLHHLALLRSALNGQRERVFLHQANVFSMHRMIHAAPDGSLRERQAVDIVSNAVSAWPLSGKEAVEAAIRQGVADSYSESPSATPPCCGGSVASAAAELIALAQAGESLQAARSVDELGTLNLTVDARARAASSIERGNIVVGVRGGTVRRGSWWEIEPSTGVTLAIGDVGWGQSMTETAVKLMLRGMVFGYCVISASRKKVAAVRYVLYLTCALGSAATAGGFLTKDTWLGILGDFLSVLGSGASNALP